MIMNNMENRTDGIAFYNEFSFESACKETERNYNCLGALNTSIYFLMKLNFKEKRLYLQSFLAKLNEKNINFMEFSLDSKDYDVVTLLIQEGFNYSTPVNIVSMSRMV